MTPRNLKLHDDDTGCFVSCVIQNDNDLLRDKSICVIIGDTEVVGPEAGRNCKTGN